jgi:Lrp/AsnC family leucine-responsive transcriptional regulator
MDEADRRLLYYLDLNSRAPIKRLAGQAGLTPEKAEARLKHFLKNGIIRRCYPELNRAKLGCTPFKIYLQFQGASPEKLQEIYDFIASAHNSGWVATCNGRWDMIVAIWAKSIEDFNRTYEAFLSRYHERVLKKATSITVEFFVSNKAWLCKDAQRMSIVKGGGIPEDLIDKTDVDILKLLGNDARIPVIDISKKLGVEPNEVDRRIRSLQKNGVILSFQTDLDMDALGRTFCKSFIYLTKSSKKDEEKLLEYCFRHPEICTMVRCIGPWDFEIEAFCPSSKEFTEMMNDIRNRYPSLVRNFEAVVINKETGTMFVPNHKSKGCR